MTCIVGLIHKDCVYLGGDSAATTGYDVSVMPHPKVFRRDPFLIGYCGSVRAANLIQYSFDPPVIGGDLMHYMVTGFAEKLRTVLSDGGHTYKHNESEWVDVQLLIATRGRLFCIETDLQVQEVGMGFDCIGSGSDIAKGSMYSTPKMAPIRRIQLALGAAQQFNAGVRGPFTIIKGTW